MFHLSKFQLKICLTHSQVKRHGKGSFRICFKVFFSNTFSTKCIPLFFNWIMIELWKDTKIEKNIVPLFLKMLLVLLQIRRISYMLHIASYHYYLLAKIHLYQSYFNMSCHWHMNICYLIRLYVDMFFQTQNKNKGW